METLTEVIRMEQEIERGSLDVYEQATTLKVTGQEDYNRAVELVGTIKAMKTKIVEFFAPMKSDSYKAWKTICEREKEHLSPVEDADSATRAAIKVYLDEQERIRREEQRRAEEQARIAAEKERQRLAKLAEKAEARGDQVKAESFAERADMVTAAPVFVPPAIEKTTSVGGTSVTTKTELKISVTDIRALCKEIAEGRAPVTLIDPANGKIKAFVKANDLKSFPGLYIEEVANISVR